MRTKNGEIHKVIDIEKGSIKIKSQYKEWIGLCCIAKHSKQLIDLIEEGDYVNGELITDKWDTRVSSIRSNFSEEDIKTILTHEQFETNCYEIKEEE